MKRRVNVMFNDIWSIIGLVVKKERNRYHIPACEVVVLVLDCYQELGSDIQAIALLDGLLPLERVQIANDVFNHDFY